MKVERYIDFLTIFADRNINQSLRHITQRAKSE